MVAKKFNYDIDLSGNELQNAVSQNLAVAPANPKTGQIWYDTANDTLKCKTENGGIKDALSQGKTYTNGTGININDTVISADTSVLALKSEIPVNYVPTSRKVNNKTLTTDITLNANDVGAMASTVKYASSFDMSLSQTDYKLTITLKDQDGTTLTSKVVDFPIESVVVSGSYDSVNKKIVLTLQSGSTIDIPVGDLISGLQSEITSSNKLSADLIANGTTNKVVTQTEKNNWNGKQDALGYTPCKKITATNPALTSASGVCTWTISNTIASADVLVQVRNTSTGAVVETAETVAANSITIKLNSASNIAAGTYTAVIIG